MERSTEIEMKTIAPSSLSRQPKFDNMEPSLPCISSAQRTAIRDASFSSYLKPEQEPNSQTDDSELNIFDALMYFNGTGSDPKASKRVSPVHANVIGLGRISSERCDFSSFPRFSSASSSVDGYGRNYRARSFHATPTASSDASWNSQTGLLSNPPSAMAFTMRSPPPNEGKKRWPAAKWLLRQRCPCSGKKSVQVEDKLSEQRSPPPQNRSFKVSLGLERQIPNPIEGRGHCTVMVPEKGRRNPVENIANEKSSPATSVQRLENREAITSYIRVSVDPSNNHCLNSTGLGHQRVLAPGCGPFGDHTTSSTSGFTFPVLSQISTPLKPINGLPSTNSSHTLEDPPRDSLEVFRPADDLISTKTSVTTTEQYRRHSFPFPGSPNSRMTTSVVEDDHDMASDASSDLFEIESFSTTQTTSHPYPILYNNNRRDSLDNEASSFNSRCLAAANIRAGGNMYRNRSLDDREPMMMTPSLLISPSTKPECYEPSEASIDWSVTTAEGFDQASSIANFSVTASEAAAAPKDETTIMRHVSHELPEKGHGGCSSKRNGGGRGGGGGLLSCRCEKAVSVGPQPVKCVGRDQGQRVVISTRHVGSRPALASKPPLARSHSARLSLPFAA